MLGPAVNIENEKTQVAIAFRNSHHGAVVVQIGKALDSSHTGAFHEAWETCVLHGTHTFVLDFSETALLDSTGLGSIFSLYRAISKDGGRILFASVTRPVHIVIEITRTYKIFPRFPTVDAALASLDGSG